MQLNNYLTVSQAARLLNVHPNTLRRWEKEKRLVPLRNSATNYRQYTYQQVTSFLLRGRLPKIEIKWGYAYAKKARAEELSLARRSLEVVVSQEATTYENQVDKRLFELLKEAVESGVKIRFIRNLGSLMMKERAKAMSRLGIKTKHRPVAGVTFSIRDKQTVRIEIPNDNDNQRLNLIIHDSKVASSFLMLFEKMWRG
ncbi:MAG: MerR family DNA-binding transcriptional regulator [bacterium]|nr:MerR family DNA-binding transcriptional regulator [bacterium]